MEKPREKGKRTSLDEVVPRSAPFVVYLDPCGACNFKCGFCPCNRSDMLKTERHQIMDWGLFEKILEDLKQFQGQVSVVNLHGFGEPLLNPRIADMARALKESGCCREVRTTTNGSLLDESMSRALIASGIDLVQVSVEALSTEGYQKLCGVSIEFETILNHVARFYELSRANGGAPKISAKIVSAAFRGVEDAARFSELFAPITDYHFIEDVEPIWSEFSQMETSTFQMKEEKDRCCASDQPLRGICSLPFTDLCIHSNGVAGACCSDWKFATQYGDAREESLYDIWNGHRHGEFLCGLLERHPIPFCAACMRKPVDAIEHPEVLADRIRKIMR